MDPIKFSMWAYMVMALEPILLWSSTDGPTDDRYSIHMYTYVSYKHEET